MRSGALPEPAGRRPLALPAIALIGIYAALIMLAAACPSEPDLRGPEHHHHGTHHKAAHSLLCVWSCQMSSATTLSTMHQLVQPTFLLFGVALLSSCFGSATIRCLIQTRAPPLPSAI